MLAELYVLTGREAGKGITASPGVPTIFVGRAATNHIRVRDPQASRVHCRVDVTADGLVLHDNNSGNGTYVNGERVDGRRRLADHDEIQLGETRIRILIESPEERARWDRGGSPSEPSSLEESLSDASQVSSVGPLDEALRPPAPRDDDDDAAADEDDPADDRGEDRGAYAPDAEERAYAPDAEERAYAPDAEERADAPDAEERADAPDVEERAEAERDGSDGRADTEPELEPEPDDRPAAVGAWSTAAARAAQAAPAGEAAGKRRTLREVLPGYRIEVRLGGHSRAGVAVYRAQQLSLDRPVALKVLLARGPGREREVQRFVREAKAIARLPHPNIVPIHDVISRGTLRVLVMEFLAGGSLADVLEGGALTPGATLRVGEAVARALAYAHAHEVVHRNVKPSNVLYAPQMEAYKLGDFGLATGPGHARAGDTSFLDLPAEGLGFVPPELLQEQPDVDPRSDVYALGATLYACAAGRPPFDGRSGAEVAAKVLRDDPPPLPGVPRPLWNVIRRAMAKAPAARYPDGAAMLHELHACQAVQSGWGQPAHATPPATPPAAPPPAASPPASPPKRARS